MLAAVALVVLWLAPGPMWQNDLAALTPVPEDLLLREAKLRGELGAPDVRYLLVLRSGRCRTAAGVVRIDRTTTRCARRSAALDAAELPSRYLPSTATQRARQAKLPERATLAAALAQASRDLPFRADLFAPFLDDVETARTLPPLTPQSSRTTPFGARLASMLRQRDDGWLALATLSGVHDATAIEAFAASSNGVGAPARSQGRVGIARRRVSRTHPARARHRARAARDHGDRRVTQPRRAWHVLAPMSLATLARARRRARVGGVSLSLFHLVALTLAAGLGLHYALFFERRSRDAAEERRTLHATLVCVPRRVLVFGMLAFSSLPVLRAIGLTVALGVGFHFCLSILMARHPSKAESQA